MKTKANTYTAFEGSRLLLQGTLTEVVLKVKKQMGAAASHSAVLIFNDDTGKVIDFNFHGSEREVARRLEIFVTTDENMSSENPGPGRPKLGVISREVSLLPRHWEWLASQAGGASGTLRRLIDEARKSGAAVSPVKVAQERAYKCMSVLGGDLQGYEEALRALYKRDEKQFLFQIKDWPKDVRTHLSILARPAFKG